MSFMCGLVLSQRAVFVKFASEIVIGSNLTGLNFRISPIQLG